MVQSLRPEEQPEQAIHDLGVRYSEYMAALGRVLDLGERAIPPLILALNHKQANPIAQALGLLMDRPEAAQAIPALLDWVVVQTPIHPDARDALVRAGARVVPELLKRLRIGADEGDDEAVRQLLDVAVRLPEEGVERVVPVIVEFLQQRNPHVRVAAADALYNLGLPQGAPGVRALRELRARDPEEAVRDAAEEALGRLGVSAAESVGAIA